MLVVAFACFFLLVAAWLFASNSESLAETPAPAINVTDQGASAIS